MKKKSNAIGVTILFALKSNRTYTGYLKSYVLNVSNWSSLMRSIKEICRKEINLTYVGIEDVFYVSGPFSESNTLGKSNLFEVNTIKGAKELLLDKTNYSYHFTKPKRTDKTWLKVSLVYFYHNTKLNDKRAMVCMIPVNARNLSEIKMKLAKFIKTEKFLKKAFPGLDILDYKYLKYIGIEDISEILTNPKRNEAFEVFYKEKLTMKTLNKLIATTDSLKTSVQNILSKKKTLKE